mmetsp:Transcript_17639/g.37055  ORF Transcript_17639/g.37055 Transcript_17639/m.37055 type:complete len:360 (-) Transcript_17639:564-1643(-)|eukprot:CAMPEP_0171342768 /NCGR_PEP_ID=MMETSP0878-20121228/15323_1 /TAXON_ID=67004 /ORGANISM="Thalassiosira weissflogii, Strain CCMP1336" /LENGTH=359 /DNA_ID=CAMNT_0011845537 /DNA_START=69 /DNA_END=1148 /DNA_ORIENTATION=-
MFSFNFSPDEGKEDSDIDDVQAKLTLKANALVDKRIDRSVKSAEKCLLVEFPPQDLSQDLFYEKLDLHSDNNLAPLCYVIPEHKMANSKRDLIKGVYEGGLKVWECSVDLCRFLAKIIDEDNPSIDGIDLGSVKDAVMKAVSSGGSTLELGCGHGLPSCFILRENIRLTEPEKSCKNKERNSIVVFIDFNDYVLHHAAIPNAQINLALSCEEDVQSLWWSRAVFAGGDWMGISREFLNGSKSKVTTKQNSIGARKDAIPERYDLILASETTYTQESCEDTAFLMMKHLKIDGGVGLVATKRFYFGVGGGTDFFSEAAELLGKCNQEPFSGLRLAVRSIRSYDTGNANIRDLLEVRCHRK